MNNVHIIIQARTGSTRLPSKILLPFAGGKTFLEWVVERCKTSVVASKVIVATTDSAGDDEIERLCKEKGYDYVRGSDDDVLARYYKAAKEFGSATIVRVTSDNPLIDIKELDRMVGMLEAEGLDYASNHPAGLPVGTGAEVFTRTSFERVVSEAKDPYEREHVTPYFYRNLGMFKQRSVAPEVVHPFAPQARLTLDTPQDLEFLGTLVYRMNISHPDKQPSTSEILNYLQQHPELVAINKEVVQKTFPKV